MTAPGLVVVTAVREAALPEPLASRALRVLSAADLDAPNGLQAALAGTAADVLWLPPWTRVDERLLAAVDGWRARGGAATGPRVARVRLRLCAAGAAFVGPAPRVVLSSAGGAALDGERPAPARGAATETLAEPWDVDLPATLSAHVLEMNEQTSVAARLRDAAGRAASWRDLTVRPAAFLARALAATTGSRRAMLPRVAIEAYREVLVAAKLWERAQRRSAAA